MLTQITDYFDLYSNAALAAGRPAPVWPQYLVVALAVLVEPYLRAYIETGKWDVDWRGIWGRTIFALIVTLLILPGIYKGTFDPEKPVSIQLMAIFTMGLGWRSLLEGVFKVREKLFARS